MASLKCEVISHCRFDSHFSSIKWCWEYLHGFINLLNVFFGESVSSVCQSCPTPCNPMDCSMPGFPVHHRLPELLKLISIESVMPFNHLILCHPLLLLPSIFPNIMVISKESVIHIRWPKYWSFSISPTNKYSGLISFRIDWLDVLAVLWTLKSLLQHHSSKASICQCSAFFIVHVSHLYMTTGKTIALIRWPIFGKVIFLLFNILSRLVIALLPRSKHLLISCCSHNLQWFWSSPKWSLSLFPSFPQLFAMK